MAWDTIVIGSGAGGLTAAVALARAGQRVLVVEQHYLPGGWTHSFSLEGYRFSPGVHYIGELGPGGAMRRLYEGLDVARDLTFRELAEDGYDHFIVGSERMDVPRGRERYLDRLTQRFPHEREGFRRYFETLDRVHADILRCEDLLTFPKVATVPLVAPNLLRWGWRPLSALLDKTIRDPLARAFLCGSLGNHALPSTQVSLPIHAAMIRHYDEGGFYPEGGARRMPNAFLKALRRNGGEIRMRTRVTRILVEHGRVVGVKLENGERLEAQNVISNADPFHTYGSLLAEEHCPRQYRRARRREYSLGLLSLFCAVDMDLAGMGYDSGNYWWYRDADIDGQYSRMARTLPQRGVDGLFVTATTLKDPTHLRGHRHTLEMFTFVPYAPFAQWAGRPQGERGEEYEALKRQLANRMLEAAENVIPGVSRHIVFSELGTPLSNDYYCETVRGAVYGTAKTPSQVGPFSFDTRGAIPGLHCCGASTISHGVAGASMSGLFAARQILRVAKVDALLSPTTTPLRVLPSDLPAMPSDMRDDDFSPLEAQGVQP